MLVTLNRAGNDAPIVINVDHVVMLEPHGNPGQTIVRFAGGAKEYTVVSGSISAVTLAMAGASAGR